MSQFLIIFATDENIQFECEELIEIISNMNGFYKGGIIHESNYSAYMGYYRYEEQEISFDIGKNKSFISVKRLEKAAFDFALSLQQLLNIDLSATDDSYSFVCQLDKISSIKEFESVISQGIYMNEK